MSELLRAYRVPVLLIAGQVAISLYFVLAGRLPDAASVLEWPSGLSTQAVPLWVAAIFAPLCSAFILGAMLLDLRVGLTLRGERVEDWRRRGVPGVLTNASLLAMLILHWLALENVASRWTLDQGLLISAAGMVLGAFMLAIGNYQTKVGQVGLWALTPWRVEDAAARQHCQRVASRVAIGAGAAILVGNVLLARSDPIAHLGAAPLYPQLVLSFGLGLGVYILVAILTWPLARLGS